ncbi:MAG: hypothetical protein ACI9DC_003362 [Gammaproteobacteria bacterium]|jgi:hypothetical protein
MAKRKGDTVQRADGKGILRDADGEPWPRSAFENDSIDAAFERAENPSAQQIAATNAWLVKVRGDKL